MPYVYSTLTAGQNYTAYTKGGGDLPVVQKVVTINGGTNLPDKNLITPRGVVTEVSTEDLEFLLDQPAFIQHVENGFITFDTAKKDVEVAVSDLQGRDGSAPLVPEDIAENDAQVINAESKKGKGKGKK